MSTWYHGSNQLFTQLRAGSTVTRWRALAEAFSHKPDTLCIQDDGSILHNGSAAGYLYEVLTDSPDDLYPHPRSTMEPGLEYLTSRPLPVRLMGTVPPVRAEDAAKSSALILEMVRRQKDGQE